MATDEPESQPTRKSGARPRGRRASRPSRPTRRPRCAALRLLCAVLGAAALVVVVAIVVSGGGSSDEKAKGRPAAAQKATGAIPGEKESAEMLAGIPQSGIYLGNPAAPVRLVEFADLQCPFCREYALQVLPQLVQDYVRSGKVRMEFRNLVVPRPGLGHGRARGGGRRDSRTGCGTSPTSSTSTRARRTRAT